MSFLKKSASFARKKREGSESPKPAGTKSDRPPKARTVSSDVSQQDQPKRRQSLGSKGRKRLSSLFSSSSLSSYTSDRDASASPSASLRPSPLNPSSSTSGASTPTRASVQTAENGMNGKGLVSPDADGAKDGLRALSLGTPTSPLVSSPETSPTLATTSPPNSAAALPRSGMPTRKRTPSLYSEWDLSTAAEESSDDEDEAFMTPSEGLSEVEEEDEEEEHEKVRNPNLDKTNVAKGAEAQTGDVLGTGPSTIRRTKPAAGETRVRKRTTNKAATATEVDQAGSLPQDLDTCREVLTLFLRSKMREAEDLCYEKDPEENHLYLLSAHGIINGLKGMMTFDSNDLHNALEICKATAVTASALRKPADSLVSRLGGLVRSGAGVQRVKAMTPLERHAELVYAETSLMKAMLAIIAGGDWLGLVREALNMRTAHGIYRTLQQYLEESDKDGFDDDIDMDFRSGVLLGTGTSSLMLSLLPGKVLKIAEVFGYAGDRTVALNTLMAAGGWKHGVDKPDFDEKNEGIRRPVCDMILLAFHLVISVLMPVDGVDIPLARSILAYNMRRYPDGIFFLYFQARLHTNQCEPELANKTLQRALDLHLEYVQLQHMCLWDYALNHFQLANYKGALDCFSILKEESNWSRAVYTYSAAACLLELADEDGSGSIEEADKLMKALPKLTKKIAGKSLPIEKLCNRKARKFEAQGHRLYLPATELAYVYGALGYCPRDKLLGLHKPRIDAALKKLDETTPEEYGEGQRYWDDYCLGHFLRGYVQFIARYQPSSAAETATRRIEGQPSDDEVDRGAEADFQAVIRHGPDVELDHYILYHCHYELGRLYARRGDKEKAKINFDVVMAGKLPYTNHHEKKSQGKYSLEGALLLKTHAALQSLSKGEQV